MSDIAALMLEDMTSDHDLSLPADDEPIQTWWSRPAEMIARAVLQAGQAAKTLSLIILVIPTVLTGAMIVIGLLRGSNAATFAIVAGMLIGVVLGRYAVLRQRTLRAVMQHETVTAELRSLAKAGKSGKALELNKAMRRSTMLRYLMPPRINVTGLWTVLALATIPLSALLLLTVSTMSIVTE